MRRFTYHLARGRAVFREAEKHGQGATQRQTEGSRRSGRCSRCWPAASHSPPSRRPARAIRASTRAPMSPRAAGPRARPHHRRRLSRRLAVAAERRARLAGKSLAQIADATSGKSAAGLTEALVAARKARLCHARPEAAQTRRRRGQPRRRTGRRQSNAYGAAARIAALFASPARAGSVAASYLGVRASQLQGRAALRQRRSRRSPTRRPASRGGLDATRSSARRAAQSSHARKPRAGSRRPPRPSGRPGRRSA